MKLPLLGGTNEAFSQDQNFQKTVNWYPEKDPTGRNDFVLYPTPGSEVFSSPTSGVITDTILWYDPIAQEQSLYVASEDTLYKVNLSTGTSSTVATAFGGTRSFLAANEEFLVLVSGEEILVWDGVYALRSNRFGEYFGTGPQLIGDPRFRDTSAWSLGTGWTQSTAGGLVSTTDGHLAYSSAGTNSATYSVSLDPGEYVAEINVFNYVSGDIRIDLYDGSTVYSSSTFTGDGTTQVLIDASAGSTITEFRITGINADFEINRALLHLRDDFAEGELAPETITFIDGYFVVSTNSVNIAGTTFTPSGYTGRIYISELLDPKSWNPLDFATAEFREDRISRVINHQGRLWLIGENSTEVWYNSGNPDFPFEPVRSAQFDIGTLNPFSVVSTPQSLYFVGSTSANTDAYVNIQGTERIDHIDSIVQFSGNRYVDIASYSIIDQIISKFSSLSSVDYVGGSFLRWKGHEFYVLNIYDSTTSLVLVYDPDTKLWFQWDWANTSGGHEITSFTRSTGKNLIGCTDGKIRELKDSLYTDDSTAIKRTRQSSLIHAEDDPLFFKELEIISDGGSHSDSMTLYWSDDGGRNFTSGLSETISDDMKFRRLGRATNGRIFKIETSSDEFCPLIDVYATVEKGDD